MQGKRRYLTAKQRKAIILLANGMSEADVADEINLSEHTVKSWIKHNELFRTQYDSKIEDNYGIDSERRRRRAQSMLNSLYHEFSKRMANGELKEFTNKDLVKSIQIVSHELRLDTPEDVTSKTEHRHSSLPDLQERFSKSRSGKIFQTDRKTETDPRLGRVSRKQVKVVRDDSSN